MDDEIRPPDEIITEQLLPDNRSDFDREMEEAIYISEQEFREKEQSYKMHEDQILEEYNNETNKRRQVFEKLLFDLNKIGKIDKEIKGIYDIIEPIIDAYCLQYIITCELDVYTYKKIFNLLGKIRTDKNAVQVLQMIIIFTEDDTIL